MITVSNICNRILSENQKKGNDSTTKYFIYLDQCSYMEFLRDINNSSQMFESTWDPKSKKFMGNRIFQVTDTNFHFNIVKML